MAAINLKTKYSNCRAEVTFPGKYSDGSLAIELIDAETYEPELRATVCIADYGYTPPPNHVVIKNYSENEGLLPCLISEGVIKAPALEVPGPNGIGFPVCELMPGYALEEPMTAA